jgi:hypothetical protein
MVFVDTALLELTEWGCRRFQAWTGRTNVWLAFHLTNLTVVLYFTWVTALYWSSAILALRVFVALFCGGVFVILTKTIFRVSLDASEAQAYRRLAKGLRNPRRIRDVQLRIAFLTISIVMTLPLWLAYTLLGMRFMLATELLAVLTTVLLYILACDPLPPCEGKLRERFRALSAVRAQTSTRFPFLLVPQSLILIADLLLP